MIVKSDVLGSHVLVVTDSRCDHHHPVILGERRVLHFQRREITRPDSQTQKSSGSDSASKGVSERLLLSDQKQRVKVFSACKSTPNVRP